MGMEDHIEEVISSKEETKELMTKLLVNESGNLNPNCQKSWFLKRSGMKRLMASINHHTSFLDSKASLSERRFCLDNNFSGYPICISCGAEVRKFHGNSIKKYNKCCSQSCANRIGNSKKPKELYDSNWDDICKYLTYLEFKLTCVKKQELICVKLDIPLIKETLI